MFNYTEEAMQSALSAVANGMSLRTAATMYGVPKTTLLYKRSGKHPAKRKMGPPTALSQAEEKMLCDWIIHMGKCGFPITKSQLLDNVQRLLQHLNRETVFKDNRPGRAWFRCFLKRNPEISERVYQNLKRERSSVTEIQIRSWFNEINGYLEEKQYLDILNDPTRIFNMDEIAFFLNPVGSTVLAKKGSKSRYSFVQNDENECLTSLIGSNADGTLIPPMVVFPYVRIPERLAKSAPKGWGIGKSESGWMTGETFFEYIAKMFCPWLTENKIQLPVIVFIDGHTSHLTYALSELCTQNGIILLALFPNATHIIQPMDNGLFHVLKDHWRDKIYQFRIDHNNATQIKREDFCGLLNDILETMKTEPSILRSVFHTCGLYPFNADSIDYARTIKIKSIDPLSLDGVSLDSREKNNEKSEINFLLHLTFIEEYIGEDKLNEFKSAGDVWNGALEDKSLFDVWNQIRTDLENIVNESYTVVAVSNDINETIVSEDLSEVVKIETEYLPEEDDYIAYNSDSLNYLNCCDESTETKPLLYNINAAPSTEVVIHQVNIPEPSNKNIFFPSQPEKRKSRKPKEKVRAETTSGQWKEYCNNKQKSEEDGLKDERMKQRQAIKLDKEKKIAENKKLKAVKLIEINQAKKAKIKKKENKKVKQRNIEFTKKRNKRRDIRTLKVESTLLETMEIEH